MVAQLWRSVRGGQAAALVSWRALAAVLAVVALVTLSLSQLSSSLSAAISPKGDASGAQKSKPRPSPTPSAYPSPDVSCLLQYGEPHTHALLNSPTKVNIFFIKTSNETWFSRSGRAAGAELHDLCALDSAASKNPQARVFLFSNTLRCDALGPELAARVHLVRYSYETVFAPYPEVAAWYAANGWYGDFAVNNLSNLLRLVLLHRYGGVYLDTDVLSLRGIAKARVNSLGLQAEDEVNNAVLVFRKGHTLLRAAIQDAIAQFKNVWGNQGPGLLTRWWGSRSRRRGQWATVPAAALNASQHASVYLQPREAWYPVEHTDAGAFLQPVNVTWNYVGTIISTSPLVHVWHSQRYKTAPAAAAARPPPSAASRHAWAHPLLPQAVYRVSQAASELSLQDWVMGHACPRVMAAAAEAAEAAAAEGGASHGGAARVAAPPQLLPPDEPPLPPLPEASLFAGGLSFPAGTTTHTTGPGERATEGGSAPRPDADAQRLPVLAHPRTAALLADAAAVRTVPSILNRAAAPPLSLLAPPAASGGGLPTCGGSARLAVSALTAAAGTGAATTSVKRAGYTLSLWVRMVPPPPAADEAAGSGSSDSKPLCDPATTPQLWAASRKAPGRYVVLRRHPSGAAYLAYYEGTAAKGTGPRLTPLINRVSTMLPLHTGTWRHVVFTHAVDMEAPKTSVQALGGGGGTRGKQQAKAALATSVAFTETVEAYVDGLLTFRRAEHGNITLPLPATGKGAGGTAEKDAWPAQVIAAVLPAAVHAELALVSDSALPGAWSLTSEAEASGGAWAGAKSVPNPDGGAGLIFDALGTHGALGALYPGALDSAAVQALRNTQLAAVAARLAA